MVSQVQDTGIAHFAEQVVSANVMKYIGIGEGTGQAVTATTLAADTGETRATGTLSQETTNTTGDTARVTGTVTATGARAVTEVGVFDNASSGDLDVYADFAAVNLVAADTITFTIDIVGDQA